MKLEKGKKPLNFNCVQLGDMSYKSISKKTNKIMNHAKKIISKLPLVDLNGLEWTIEMQTVYIQEHTFCIEAGNYEILVSAYLEMVRDRIYAIPNYLEVSENTENGWAIIDITEEEYEAISMAINDVIQ